MAHWARQTPNAIAIVEVGHRYTYADLATLIVKTTKYMRAAGVSPGTIAGIECSSFFMHLVVILACECLGITTTSLAPVELNSDNELLSRCDVLYVETVNDAVRQRPQVVPLTIDRIAEIVRIPLVQADFGVLEFQPEPESGGRIVKTSGTTGKQKCMCNSSIGIERGVQATEIILNALDASANFLCLYPFSYRPSYTDSILALRSGRTVVFTALEIFFQDLAAIGDSHTVLMPSEAVTLCARFEESLCAEVTGPRDPGVKCGVQINGGALSASLRRDLLASFATSVCNTYSSNETNYVSLVDGQGVGTLLPDAEVRIVGEDGRDQPPGEIGTVVIRTSRMVPGYLWNEALTARHFVGGWHITSDLGFCPVPGQLVVVGRADDMLNIGGIKVPPQPIEDGIKAIEGVTDAVLLSIEDSLGLSDLHLVVERSDPTRDEELDRLIRPLVHHHGRDFVAHYRDSLPRTDSGKIRRGALKQLIAAGS
ncbi:MAG TPA: class I adenylate-forming enzyme family protein [Rhodopila sp.]|nr:class I adenylate-forming enzyme family protein [Rhodopila sp.]